MLHEISNNMSIKGIGNFECPVSKRYKKLEITFSHSIGGIWLYPLPKI